MRATCSVDGQSFSSSSGIDARHARPQLGRVAVDVVPRAASHERVRAVEDQRPDSLQSFCRERTDAGRPSLMPNTAAFPKPTAPITARSLLLVHPVCELSGPGRITRTPALTHMMTRQNVASCSRLRRLGNNLRLPFRTVSICGSAHGCWRCIKYRAFHCVHSRRECAILCGCPSGGSHTRCDSRQGRTFVMEEDEDGERVRFWVDRLGEFISCVSADGRI